MKQKKNMEEEKNKKNIIHLEELSWKQIGALDRDKTIFFLPISPLEEHGPHLPVGTDLLVSKDAVDEAIKILSRKKPSLNYVLLPAVPLGYSKLASGFPGTVSVRSRVIRDIVFSFGSSLAQHGFKFLVICSYHMDLVHLKGIYVGMQRVMRKYPDMQVCEPCGPYFYNKEAQQREPKTGFDTSKELHGGFRETSLMRYQYPYLVDEFYKKLPSVFVDLYNLKSFGKTFRELGASDGYIGSPARASIEYGRWFFRETVNSLIEAALGLYEGKKPCGLPKRVKWMMRILPF